MFSNCQNILSKVRRKIAMIYGYCRVSSKSQLDNNSLDQQEQEILSKYNNAIIYREQFTGKTTDRPKFNEVVDKIKKGDVLVVTKLDRLARNTIEGIQVIEKLFEKEVSVHVLNGGLGLLEDTTLGRFFLTTLLAVAEMERSMIIERTQAGKEIAKQNPDFREGRPKVYKRKQIDHALDLVESGRSYRDVAEITGMSESTLYRAARKRKAEQLK